MDLVRLKPWVFLEIELFEHLEKNAGTLGLVLNLEQEVLHVLIADRQVLVGALKLERHRSLAGQTCQIRNRIHLPHSGGVSLRMLSTAVVLQVDAVSYVISKLENLTRNLEKEAYLLLVCDVVIFC